ncbi:Hypothetical predicted protein [Olea europaea subsp. europaea]|uniref:Uncharacterized protein n=1 Tax=Olea europaea subsp. europaea TaxID=158383 RepID=A0A8S0VK23_OLEEU|nr:Hypothetical predicted protein [Olea europaea subsp. europaea]
MATNGCCLFQREHRRYFWREDLPVSIWRVDNRMADLQAISELYANVCEVVTYHFKQSNCYGTVPCEIGLVISCLAPGGIADVLFADHGFTSKLECFFSAILPRHAMILWLLARGRLNTLDRLTS